MGIFDWMFGKKIVQPQTSTKLKLIHDVGEGFYNFGGDIYKSDIVRACIRPKSKAIGKLIAKHIRDNESGFKENPDVNIRFLLEDPNPLMSGQMLQEKLATQLELNNNAFALIKRDEEMFRPYEIYPVPAVAIELLEGPHGDMYLKFQFHDGKQMTVPYADIIHLRQDFNSHNVFGDAPGPALAQLMEVVTTIDQGIIKAIKNSAIIRWILKFKSVLKPQDIDMQVDEFVENYLNIEKNGGAIPSDPRYDLEQVKPKSYVPDDKQMSTTTERIYNFFNTNRKIVQSIYDENEWNAYYESVIQPVAMQLSGEYTRKLFSRRERGHGNKIIFESSALQYASMRTKMSLVQMVDRGSMVPNEWRKILNLGPIENGNKPIRRLDTAEVKTPNIDVKGGDDDGQNRKKGDSDDED
ncbi:phage portal protein [Halalkalibacterium ligniniphilum]|uniref:phage portal protein n=1 Tax=Halalkalibacterium ligniniphilum TaxID=1134413 RepID=UPI0004763A59|nr:phage portal protein [Halalkalibacterium ligniniphilum]